MQLMIPCGSVIAIALFVIIFTHTHDLTSIRIFTETLHSLYSSLIFISHFCCRKVRQKNVGVFFYRQEILWIRFFHRKLLVIILPISLLNNLKKQTNKQSIRFLLKKMKVEKSNTVMILRRRRLLSGFLRLQAFFLL